MHVLSLLFSAAVFLCFAAVEIGLPIWGILLLVKKSHTTRNVGLAVALILLPLLVLPIVSIMGQALFLELFGSFKGGFGA